MQRRKKHLYYKEIIMIFTLYRTHFYTKLLMKTGTNSNVDTYRLLNIAKGVNNGIDWNSSIDRRRSSACNRSSQETRRYVINFTITTAITGVAAKAAPAFCGDM